MSRPLDEFEIAARKRFFSELYGLRWQDEVCLLPPKHQGRVHELLRLAFNAGTNYQRRLEEPVQVGGMD